MVLPGYYGLIFTLVMVYNWAVRLGITIWKLLVSRKMFKHLPSATVTVIADDANGVPVDGATAMVEGQRFI